MLSPRALHWLFRLSLAGFLTVLGLYLALVAAIIWPGPFFRYQGGNAQITFHSEAPIPPEAAQMADDVVALLARGPMGRPDGPIEIWLVEDGLPLRIFFSGSPTASGLTYPVASLENVFLRHADFLTNRLIRGDLIVPPPRTLSYYLVHEITHLQVAQRVGRLGIVRLPRWVNEGFADYVALGPAPPEMIQRIDAGEVLRRRDFGSYPRERACVTLALARLGNDLNALFALEVELPEAGGCPIVPEFGIALGAVRP